jgi:hypothetical protein
MPHEALVLKVIVLSSEPPKSATLRWRPLGQGRFAKVPLEPVARAVYRAKFPVEATINDGLEYYIEVDPVKGHRVRFPATAPHLNQSLVLGPH